MAENDARQGAASLGSATSTVTVVSSDDLMRQVPFPTLLITTPANVEAMEVRTSVNTLHQALVLVTNELSANWSTISREEDFDKDTQQQEVHSSDDVSTKKAKTSTTGKLSKAWNSMFGRGNQESPSAEKTKKNTEKVNLMLDKMRDEINTMLENGVHRSLENFDRLSPEAQEALVQFWREMRQFIGVFADWIEKLITFMIDRLLAGQRLDVDAFAKALQAGMDIINNKLGNIQEVPLEPQQRQDPVVSRDPPVGEAEEMKEGEQESGTNVPPDVTKPEANKDEFVVIEPANESSNEQANHDKCQVVSLPATTDPESSNKVSAIEN